MSAEYDEASKSIKLSWSYSGDGDVSFKVKQSVDGGGYSEIQSSSAKEAVIPNAKEGSVYKFQVTAVTEDGESDPASVTLKVNAAEDDESKADDEKKDEDDEKKQDADDDQDKDKQNNGNSNQPDDQNSGNPDQNNQNPGNTDGRKDDDADDQNKDQNKDKNKNPDQDSNTDDQQTNSNGQSTGTH